MNAYNLDQSIRINLQEADPAAYAELEATGKLEEHVASRVAEFNRISTQLEAERPGEDVDLLEEIALKEFVLLPTPAK
jgi:hypothetical protein